jgi:hypothetical protein
MAAVVLAMRTSGFLDPLAPLVRIIAEIAVGVGVYAGAHTIAWRLEGLPDGVERSIIDFARPLLRRAFSR